MKINAIAAVRVSSMKQGLQGDSLEQQIEQIKLRSNQLASILGVEITISKIFEFAQSASGELDSQPIQTVIAYVKQNPGIKYFFIKSIDRFTRSGSTVYGLLKSQLVRYGVQIIDCYGIINNQNVNTLAHRGISYDWSTYQPSYITEILEAERSKAEVRDILTRLIGAQIGYIRQGYRVRPAPVGYQNKRIDTEHGKRCILEPNLTEAPWIIRMFELRAQGNVTEEEITEQINALGYKSRQIKKHDPHDVNKIIGLSGEKPLTLKQLQRIIHNPIYAGINTEKWTDGKPVKEKFTGLVPIALWNKANCGKFTIIENGDTMQILKGKPSSWEKPKKRGNPDFAYKSVIICPICRNPVYASFTRSGQRMNGYYHCQRKNHKRWEVRIDTLHEAVKIFVHDVEFTDAEFIKIKEKILSKWEERRSHLNTDSLTITANIQKLKADRQILIDKIKILTSPIVIKEMEQEVEKIDQQVTEATGNMKKVDSEEISVQEIINTVYYFFEHFEDLLLGGPDPLKNAAMFGLLFEELPTYENLVFRTVSLASLFKLKSHVLTSQNTVCESAGIRTQNQ